MGRRFRILDSSQVLGAVALVGAWINMKLTRRAQLRARENIFKKRPPVELQQWATVHGFDIRMDQRWIQTFLTTIGEEYGIDPRRILPSDRLGHELGFPSQMLNQLHHQDGLFQGLIINLNEQFHDVWSLPALGEREEDLSVRDLLTWLAERFPLREMPANPD